MKPGDRLLTVKEVEAILRISRTAVERRIRRGAFPVIRMGRAVRISQAAIDQYIEKCTVKGEEGLKGG